MHSNANFGERVGAGVGAVIGALVVVGEAIVGALTAEVGIGVGLLAHALLGGVGTIAAFASGGAAIGKWIGGGSSSVQGYVSSSATRTFIGAGMPLAARIGDLVDCDGSNLEQGSDSVSVEQIELSRRDDKTLCAGTVAKGCDTVFIGGGTTDLVTPDQLSEDDPVQSWTLFVVDWGGAIVGLGIKGVKAAWSLAALAPDLGGFGLKVASKVSDTVLGKESAPSRALNYAKLIYGAGKGVKEVRDKKELIEQKAKTVANASKTGTDASGVAIKEGQVGKPTAPYNDSPQANARRAELQRRLRIRPKTIWGTRATQDPP
jgi:uncharacterized Zn-binding protein involved in type VI secretion